MSRARFIAAARLEFLAEVIYYSEAQAGLDARFTSAVEEAAARALAFPLSGSPYYSDTRRILVKDSPFSLIYRPEPEGIVILRLHIMRGVLTTGGHASVPANRAMDRDAGKRCAFPARVIADVRALWGNGRRLKLRGSETG